MTFCFVDSSSFSKLFITESGSDVLRHYLFQFPKGRVAISVLAELEVTSALHRGALLGRFSYSERDQQLAQLNTTLKLLPRIAITNDVLQDAANCILAQTVRSLDAVQLASALLFRRELGANANLLFIASDIRLLQAARAEGFDVWNPADPTSLPPTPVN